MDEHDTVERSVYLQKYSNLSFNDPAWNELASYDQPKLGEYIYALPLYISGMRDPQQYLNNIGFYYDQDNQSEWSSGYFGSVTPRNIPVKYSKRFYPIIEARKAAVIMSAVSVGLMYFIGVSFGGILYGLILAIIAISNPFFKWSGVSAMGDSPLIMFILMHYLVMLWYFRAKAKNQPENSFIFVLVNVLAGFAVSVKLNGILLLPIFGLCLFIADQGILSGNNFKKYLYKLILSTLTVLVVFILINPFVWKNPLIRTVQMFEHRINIYNRQQAYFNGLNAGKYSLYGRSENIINTVLNPDQNNRLFQPMSKYFPVESALFLIGLGIVFYHTLKCFRNYNNFQSTYKYLILGVWTFIWFYYSLIIAPVPFERYYLPAMLAVLIFQGLGAGFLIKKIYHLLRKLSSVVICRTGTLV
jgi:4-amino-4-deoxy-L-arabinose transferase-like glycosyltransferase